MTLSSAGSEQVLKQTKVYLVANKQQSRVVIQSLVERAHSLLMCYCPLSCNRQKHFSVIGVIDGWHVIISDCLIKLLTYNFCYIYNYVAIPLVLNFHSRFSLKNKLASSDWQRSEKPCISVAMCLTFLLILPKTSIASTYEGKHEYSLPLCLKTQCVYVNSWKFSSFKSGHSFL